jgi:magnesium transporter
MSSGIEAEAVKNAVPLADLSVIDTALKGDDAGLREAVKRVRPADLGRDLSRRSIEDSRRLFEAIDDRHGAAMLRAAHVAVAGQLVSTTASARAARIVSFMPTDHQVQILGTLEPTLRTQIEGAMDPTEVETVKRLLAYDALAIGRLMTPKIWKANRDQTAGEAMEVLRKNQDEIEVAVNVYVVDGEHKLVGVMPLREVSLAPITSKLGDIMTPNPIAVRENLPRGDAADIIRTHDFLSLPVVDTEGHLVGAVRVDDVLDAVLDKVGDGFLNQGGVAGKIAGQAPYFQTRIWRTVRSRLTWLILLFVAETATGTVLRYFEDELAKVVALSFFVPLLIGTGGNAGSQTVSTVIRALALGEVRTLDVWRVVMREVTAGVLLGVLLGSIAFGRALLWGVGYELAFCVAITILVVCTWANSVGATIPIVAQRLGIDPTVISAPLITTLVDASGLFIYFTIAHLTIAQLSDKPPDAATYTCSVVELRSRPNLPDERLAEIPPCDDKKKAGACWRLDDYSAEEPKLVFAIERGGVLDPSVHVSTSCTPKP